MANQSASQPTVAAGMTGGNALEFLDKTHRELEIMLKRLKALFDGMSADSITAAQREEAADVCAWFNLEARQHHMDEEAHIFPPLLASGNTDLVHTTQRLIQDHGWIEQNWVEMEPAISALACGQGWYDMDVVREQVGLFHELYNDHMLLEESVAYPAASPLLAGADAAKIWAAMAKRRAQRESAAKA